LLAARTEGAGEETLRADDKRGRWEVSGCELALASPSRGKNDVEGVLNLLLTLYHVFLANRTVGADHVHCSARSSQSIPDAKIAVPEAR
jgi:hypothetical protein